MKSWTVGLIVLALFALQVAAIERVYFDDYSVCGDGVCSYDESAYGTCYQDCGYSYGGGYGTDYGSSSCYVSTPLYAIRGELVPIQVTFNGGAPYSIELDCDNGDYKVIYRNSYYSNVIFGYCRYDLDGIYYPRAYAGFYACYGDYVQVERGYYPTPTYYPTATPTNYPTPTAYPSPSPTPIPQPSCALTSYPSIVKEGESSIVTVNYYNLNSVPNSIAINCGNGEYVNAVGCYGKSNSCSQFCNYENAGTYTVSAIASGTACSSANVKVNQNTAEKCSDGTQFGSCSISKPKYCDDGYLIDRASICGCPDGKVQSGEKCITPAGSCYIDLNPSTVRANGESNVLISYNGIALQGGSQEVRVLCGNGDTQYASCDQTSELKGICSANCAYGEEATYPKNYIVKAYVSGTSCSTANLQVIAPSETMGTLLTKVTDCDTGYAIQHAKVQIEGQEDFYTDSNGQLKVQLEPATYTVGVSKQGYLGTSTTSQVSKGKISTASVCLEPEGCDITAELVSTPRNDDSGNPLLYQIKITNNLNLENTILISYSSALHLEGPTSLVLQAKESTIVSIYAYTNVRTTGTSLGTVSIRGSGDCAKNIDLPINVIGGLSIEVEQSSKESFSGKHVCYEMQVRNRGNNEGTVTMTYSGDFEADFSQKQFYLNAQEIKSNLQFCVDVPSGESGDHTFLIRALSGISDASAYVSLKVLDTGDFSTDVEDSCILARDGELYPVTIDNDAADGDYSVSLRSNDVNARVQPSMLYNFKKGTSRTVYISVSPGNIGVYDEYVELILKKDSKIAMQEDICISSYDYYYGRDGYDYYYYEGGNYYYRPISTSIYSSLSQATLNIPKGGSATTTLTVKNTGNRGDYFSVKVDSQITASISESSFYLAPNEQKLVTIKFTAGNEEKRYSIPVKIYSGRGSGGVVYDGGSGGSSTAYITCGNGKTVALQCDEGSASCFASCKYDYTGTYTIDANIGNQECRENSIRVIADSANSRGCAVSAESFIRDGTRTTVKIKYYNLPYAPASDEIMVVCGNGNTATASGCDGTSGTCSATCYYGASGTYNIGANAGGLSCTSSDIKVGTDTSYCSISSPSLIQEGDIATISLKYRNAYFGGQFYPYNYADSNDIFYDEFGNSCYYGDRYIVNGLYRCPGSGYDYYSGSGKLLKTETVIVNVGSGGSYPTIEPGDLSPDALTVKRVLAGDLPASGKGNVALTLQNKRDYKISDVLLLMENLPAGVTLSQVQPFDVEANAERTIYFQLMSAGAQAGTYKVKAKLRMDSQTVEKEFDLRIAAGGETPDVELVVKEIRYEQIGGNAVAKVEFEVRNLEQSQLQVSALFTGFPEGWDVKIDPSLGSMNAGKSVNFSANITAVNSEQRSYSGMIELRSVDGRKFTYPIVLEFQKLNPLSGLFSFFGGFGMLQVAILLLIVGAVIFAFFYKREEPEEEDKEGILNDKLKSINDQIGPGGKQKTLLDEGRFTKKKVKWDSASEDTEYIEMDDDEKGDKLSWGRREDDDE
ncbi:MAG: hypothetical protein ABIG96_00815 [Candidatus Micrarchaeota archaeon]